MARTPTRHACASAHWQTVGDGSAERAPESESRPNPRHCTRARQAAAQRASGGEVTGGRVASTRAGWVVVEVTADGSKEVPAAEVYRLLGASF